MKTSKMREEKHQEGCIGIQECFSFPLLTYIKKNYTYCLCRSPSNHAILEGGPHGCSRLETKKGILCFYVKQCIINNLKPKFSSLFPYLFLTLTQNLGTASYTKVFITLACWFKLCVHGEIDYGSQISIGSLYYRVLIFETDGKKLIGLCNVFPIVASRLETGLSKMNGLTQDSKSSILL